MFYLWLDDCQWLILIGGGGPLLAIITPFAITSGSCISPELSESVFQDFVKWFENIEIVGDILEKWYISTEHSYINYLRKSKSSI